MPFKYKIILFDNEIPVCEIKYNDDDMANFIGAQLTSFIAEIQNPIPDSYSESHPTNDYNDYQTWAGRNFRVVPPETDE